MQPDRIGGRKRAKLAVHAERVQAVLAAEPDVCSQRRPPEASTRPPYAFSPAKCAHYLAHAGYVPSNREALWRLTPVEV
jgi:hypothetical protein